MVKGDKNLRGTVDTISSSDINAIKKRLLEEYNNAYDENLKTDSVSFKFRVYE